MFPSCDLFQNHSTELEILSLFNLFPASALQSFHNQELKMSALHKYPSRRFFFGFIYFPCSPWRQATSNAPGLGAGRTSEFRLRATLIESALFHYADDLNSFQLSFYSSDKSANGLEETTSVSSPSCSSSPSLLGLSSLLLIPGGASRWDENSSASFSCCRNRLLSECLSCRTVISFVSG